MKSLSKDTLGMLDEFGHRKQIVPAGVRGRFHRRRTIFQWILLVIFLALPWLTWNGEQLLWLNVAERRFHVFGLMLSAQDAPLIFVLIIVGVLSLAFLTAVFGRVWCGWACPQTVFIERIYRQIENLVEGDPLQRRKMLAGPMTLSRAVRFAVKWLLFFAASSLFAHSFAAYFVGARPLVAMMHGSPAENFNYFVFISAITALLLFDFGWFREQFCVIACPYGRFQSVLMDNDSLTVMYDAARGEPRKQGGDCINCLRCVHVCPTSIDIRNGLQMECIGCTACIDACDEIMDKVKKPRGLIRYDSMSGKSFRWLRPRPMIYFSGIVAALISAIYAVGTRRAVDVTLMRGLESPYQVVEVDGQEKMIINHLRLRLKNQTSGVATAKLSLDSLNLELIAPRKEVVLKPQQIDTLHFFVKFKAGLEKNVATSKAALVIDSYSDGGESAESQLVSFDLVGPRD